MGLTGACPAVCMPGRSLLMIWAAHCCTISQRSCRCVSVVPRARSCRMALLYWIRSCSQAGKNVGRLVQQRGQYLTGRQREML